MKRVRKKSRQPPATEASSDPGVVRGLTREDVILFLKREAWRRGPTARDVLLELARDLQAQPSPADPTCSRSARS